MNETQQNCLPVAPVAWWNETQVRVLCPYCDGYHSHALPSLTALPDRSSPAPIIQESRCQHKLGFSTRYTLEFPFDEWHGTANFEIDKTRLRYLSVECKQEQEQEDDPKDTARRARDFLDYTVDLKRRVERYPLFDDAKEDFEVKDLEWTFEDIRDESDVSLAEGLDKLAFRTRHIEKNSKCLKENSRRLEENFRRLDENLNLLKLRPLASQSQRLPRSKRIYGAIDDCLNGNLTSLHLYLDTTADKEIFIKGTDIYGDIVLHQVSSLNFPDVVGFLLNHGADPNRRNLCGRTPLMEAALWGRAYIVRLLLDHGANKDIKDGQGRRAIDFSNEGKLAQDEREHRSWTKSGLVYYEDRYQCDRERKVISALLKAGPKKLVPRVSVLAADALYSFHQSLSGFQRHLPGPCKIFNNLLREKIQAENKTIARLYRGKQFDPIDAMSVWSHAKDNSITVCGGRDMTESVLNLCDEIGFSLEVDAQKDQGRPGKYNACHAGKQLIAYLIDRHRFTADDLRPPSRLQSLENVEPPVLLREATILVSATVCSDCERFMRAVEKAFAFKIRRANFSFEDQPYASFEDQTKAFINEKFPGLNL